MHQAQGEHDAVCEVVSLELLGNPPSSRDGKAMAAPIWMRRLAFLVLFAGFGSSGLCQVDRTAYRYTTIEELTATHGLTIGPPGLASRDAVLIAPEYKYRLRFKATGRIRELSPTSQEALAAWTPMHPSLQAFLKEYTHEVEVVQDDRSHWLPWQRKLVAPFQAERAGGGDIEAYAILAGVFRGQLLLVVTAFESVR